MASTYELIVKAVDKTSTPVNRMSKSVGRLDKQAKKANSSLKLVGSALAAIGVGQLARSIVGITAKFEDFQDTLNSVTGSAKKGAEAFAFIKKFSTKTQFGVEDLTQTYIKLAGAGIEPTQKLLTTFTDTAAITTDQVGSLQAITDLFSRSVSGGLGLEDLNRLADRGVPVFRMLEEQLGLTRLELSEFGKSAEGAAKIRQALITAIDTEFGGATAGKMDNLSTAMSNFKIAVTNSADAIGSEFRPQLTGAITEATAFIEANEDVLKLMGGKLGDAIIATANGMKLLGQNLDLVRNAALTLIGVRLAGSLATIVTRMASAIKRSQGLVGIFKTMGKTLGGLLTRLPLVGSALSTVGIAATRLGPALLGPWGLALAAATGFVVGGLHYVQDSLEETGLTGVSMGEILGANWEMLKGWAVDTSNSIGESFNNTWKQVKDTYAETGKVFGIPFQKIGELAVTTGNFILNTFVAAFESIVAIAKNLPGFFRASFNAIMSIAKGLGDAIVQKMSNVFEALKLLAKGEFKAAFALAGEEVGYSFTDAVATEFNKLPSLVSGVDYDAIYGTDRLKQVGELLSSNWETAKTALRDYIGNAAEPYIAALSEQIRLERAKQELLEANTKLSTATDQTNSPGHPANAVFPGGGTGTTSDDKPEAELTFQQELIKQYQAKLQSIKDLEEALSNVSVIAAESGMQESLLTEQLQARLEAEKKALGLIKEKAEVELTYQQQLVESYKKNHEELDKIKAALANVSVLARQAGVSEEFLTEKLKEQEEQFEKNLGLYQEKALTTSDIIQNGFEDMSNSIGGELARAIRTGENMFDALGNAFKRTLDNILQQILTSQINSLLGQLFNIGPSAGGGGGGGLGSLITGLFGTPTVGAPMGGFNPFGFLTRAAGGPVSSSRSYLVGERGPELFNPTSSGSITSTDEVNNGNGTVVFQLNAVDTQTGVEFLLKNKPQIINMVSQGFNQRGRQGITS